MKKMGAHFLFWFLFFLAWQRVVYLYIDNNTDRLLFTAFDVSLVMLSFYAIYSMVTPKFFFRKNKLFFVSGLFATIIFTALLLRLVMKGFLRQNIVPIGFNFRWNYEDMMGNRYVIALLGALAGLITRLSVDRLHTERKMKEIEKNRIATELIYLRMQTNPHFLFNAINTVYIQIDDSKETAKHTLSTFSDMLRYQLYECNSEKVPIEKEIQYIRNYIELQRLRMDESYRIDFNYSAGLSGFQVAPFILLPFIENMFKHVSNGLSPNIIRGELSSVNGALRFKGYNTKSNSTGKEMNGGIGLANVRRRLELIYPRKYSLDISDTESTYTVCLQIQLV